LQGEPNKRLEAEKQKKELLNSFSKMEELWEVIKSWCIIRCEDELTTKQS